MAVLGYAFLVSLYLAAIISMPESFTLDGETVTRPQPSGLTAPIVAVLYAIPQLGAIAPPAGLLGLLAAAHYVLSR